MITVIIIVISILIQTSLASLLSDSFHTCPASDDAIKDHIKSLMAANMEKKSVSDSISGFQFPDVKSFKLTSIQN